MHYIAVLRGTVIKIYPHFLLSQGKEELIVERTKKNASKNIYFWLFGIFSKLAVLSTLQKRKFVYGGG